MQKPCIVEHTFSHVSHVLRELPTVHTKCTHKTRAARHNPPSLSHAACIRQLCTQQCEHVRAAAASIDLFPSQQRTLSNSAGP